MQNQNDPGLPPEFADIRPEVYRAFKTAIETRKWPDGRSLNEVQMQTCLQAIIAYEEKHLSPEERTGYVPPKPNDCDEKPIKWEE